MTTPAADNAAAPQARRAGAPVSDETLAELERLNCAAARLNETTDWEAVFGRYHEDEQSIMVAGTPHIILRDENAAPIHMKLIAAMRTALPALLAELRDRRAADREADDAK